MKKKNNYVLKLVFATFVLFFAFTLFFISIGNKQEVYAGDAGVTYTVTRENSDLSIEPTWSPSKPAMLNKGDTLVLVNDLNDEYSFRLYLDSAVKLSVPASSSDSITLSSQCEIGPFGSNSIGGYFYIRLTGNYAVEYNLNNGNGTAPSDTTLYTAGSNVTLQSGSGLTRPGFKFIGWGKTADATTPITGTYQMKLADISDGKITFYAIWANTQHKINFVLDGGTLGNSYTPGLVGGETKQMPTASELTKDNCSLEGIYLDSTFNTPVTSYDCPFNISEDVTLYVKWIYYPQISYNLDGATITSGYESNFSPKRFDANTITIIHDVEHLSKEGYAFDGWYDNPSFTGDYILYSNLVDVEEDITLYAKFHKRPKIIFNLNGGSILSQYTSSVTTLYLDDGTNHPLIPGSYLTKTNCAFVGWCSDPTLVDVKDSDYWHEYRAGETDDVTYFAKWRTLPAISYNIGAGASWSASFDGTKPERVVANNSVTLPSDALVKEGYKFMGWFYDSTFQIQVENNQIADNEEYTEDYTIYAKWSYIPSLSINTDGGTLMTGYTIPTILEPGKRTYLPICYEKSGYVLEGYFSDSTFDTELSSDYDYDNDCYVYFIYNGDLTNDVTIYIKWFKLPTITYVLDGGSFIDEDDVSFYKTDAWYTFLPTSDNIQKTGYGFVGWYYDSTFISIVEDNMIDNYDFSSDITVYAKWGIKYNITYVQNGLEFSYDYPTEYVSGSITDLTYLSNKSNVHFTGWFDNADFTGSKIDTINENVTGDLTLYARLGYPKTIIYRFNGGEIDSDYTLTTKYFDYEYVGLPTDENMHKDGYLFGGWCTKRDLSDTPLTTLENIPGNLYLYAYWSKPEHINYVIGDGTWTYAPEENYLTNTGMHELANGSDISNGFYYFEAWYDNPEFSGYPVTEFDTTDLTGEQTFYAKYKKYNVITYEVDGAYLYDVDQYNKYINFSYLPNYYCVYKTNYDFKGWYLSQDFEGEPIEYIEEDLGDITLYAKFELAIKKIVFTDIPLNYSYVNDNYSLNSTTFEFNTSEFTFVSYYVDFDNEKLYTVLNYNDTENINYVYLNYNWDTCLYELNLEGVIGTAILLESETAENYNQNSLFNNELKANDVLVITDISQLHIHNKDTENEIIFYNKLNNIPNSLYEGTYYVDGELNSENNVAINGNVKICLEDATLNINALTVNENATLEIFGNNNSFFNVNCIVNVYGELILHNLELKSGSEDYYDYFVYVDNSQGTAKLVSDNSTIETCFYNCDCIDLIHGILDIQNSTIKSTSVCIKTQTSGYCEGSIYLKNVSFIGTDESEEATTIVTQNSYDITLSGSFDFTNVDRCFELYYVSSYFTSTRKYFALFEDTVTMNKTLNIKAYIDAYDSSEWVVFKNYNNYSTDIDSIINESTIGYMFIEDNNLLCDYFGFSKEPTTNNPEVNTNRESGVTYKWYKQKITDKTYFESECFELSFGEYNEELSGYNSWGGDLYFSFNSDYLSLLDNKCLCVEYSSDESELIACITKEELIDWDYYICLTYLSDDKLIKIYYATVSYDEISDSNTTYIPLGATNGTYRCEATYKDKTIVSNSFNYLGADRKPVFTKPDITGYVNDKYKDVTLPENFSWDENINETIQDKAGNKYVYLIYTPSDGFSSVSNIEVLMTIKDKYTIEISNSSVEYTGSAIEPTVTVKKNGVLLDSSTYTVTYSNNTNIGTANINASGTGFNLDTTFTITKIQVNEPTVTLTYTFNGSSQTVTLSGVESYMTLDTANSTLSATNANTYTIKYTLSGNYEWATGSDGVITWVISKAKITVPTANSNLVYNGTTQTGVTLPQDAAYTIVDNTEFNSGSYQATVTLSDKTNTVWDLATPTADDQTINWSIGKVKVNVPTANSNLVYTGEEQVGVTLPVDAVYSLLFNKETNAGIYTAKASLDDTVNYVWDLTTPTNETQDIGWSIAKAKAQEPTITTNSFVYDGTEKEVTLNGVESYMTKSNDSIVKATSKGTYTITYILDSNHEWATGSDGVVTWDITKSQATITVDTNPIVKTYGDSITIPEATSNLGTVSCDKTLSDLVNAGSYTITYSVEETDNYDGDIKTVSVTINKKEVSVPSLSGSYVYTGSEQIVAINNFDSSTMEHANDSVYKSTAAGSYKVKVSLKDLDNYKWSTSFTGELEWSIAKAKAQEPTITTNSFVYDGSEKEVSINGVESFMTKSNDSIVKAINKGTYTITYTLDSNHEWNSVSDGSIEWEINPLLVEIIWSSNKYLYNGQTQVIKAYYFDVNSNEVALNVVTNSLFKESGTYIATASFANNETNYILGSVITKEYQITTESIKLDKKSKEDSIISDDETKVEILEGTISVGTKVVIDVEDNSEISETIYNNIKKELNYKNISVVKYDVHLEDNEGIKLSNIEGNKYKVVLSIPEELRNSKNIKLVYINEDGSIQEVLANQVGNQIEFVVAYLSECAIVAENSNSSIGLIILFTIIGLAFITLGLYAMWKFGVIKASKFEKIEIIFRAIDVALVSVVKLVCEKETLFTTLGTKKDQA